MCIDSCVAAPGPLARDHPEDRRTNAMSYTSRAIARDVRTGGLSRREYPAGQRLALQLSQRPKRWESAPRVAHAKSVNAGAREINLTRCATCRHGSPFDRARGPRPARAVFPRDAQSVRDGTSRRSIVRRPRSSAPAGTPGHTNGFDDRGIAIPLCGCHTRSRSRSSRKRSNSFSQPSFRLRKPSRAISSSHASANGTSASATFLLGRRSPSTR